MHETRSSLALRAALLALVAAALPAFAADLVLSGANEVPPVNTAASGKGSITVSPDGSVSGTIRTTGLNGMMAHIHHGAAGSNGPVLIPLTPGPNGEWSVPAGAKLDAAQLKAYQAGELYVNVHTEAHKGGEIRAQLAP